MAERDKETPEPINCRYVIKVYRDINNSSYLKKWPVGSNQSYVEVHSVSGSKDNRYLGPGKPLTFDFFRKILAFESRKNDSEDFNKELIDPRIIYYGSLDGIHRIIWWEKRCEKQIYIRGKNPFECRVPSMVFCLRNYNKFFAFAMKGISRPEPGTELYNPPFENTYTFSGSDRSNVCLGNVSIDSSMMSSPNYYVQEYEKYWWKSEFEGIHRLLEVSKETGKFPSHLLGKPVATIRQILS